MKSGKPAHWYAPVKTRETYAVKAAGSDVARSGKACLLIESTKTPVKAFGNSMQAIEAKAYRGKRVRFEGYAKYVGKPGDGSVMAWLRADRRTGETGLFDNMARRPILTSEWSHFVIEGTVDDDATTLNYGIMLNGTGTALADDLSLSILK